VTNEASESAKFLANHELLAKPKLYLQTQKNIFNRENHHNPSIFHYQNNLDGFLFMEFQECATEQYYVIHQKKYVECEKCTHVK
jgi:hypothetical protein